MIKKIFQFCLLFFSITNAYAQAPAIEWQNCFGGIESQNAFGIDQTSDGGFITCGISQNGATIVKLDAGGNILWTSYPGSGLAFCIKQTADGGYITAGYAGGNEDYWIARLNSSGDAIWIKTYGGSLSDRAFSVQQTTDGGFIVGGEAESMDGDVTGSHGGSEAWILKLNDLGDIIWKRSFGGSAFDMTRCIKQTPDGGYIFGGTTLSTDGDPLGTAGMNGQLWIVKLDASGNIEWQKRYGSIIGGEFCTSICLTGDGGYAATAAAYKNGGDVTGLHGTSGDFWIVRLNGSGDLLWQKAVGGSSYETPTCIIESDNGCLLVLGWGFSDDGDFTGNHGGADDWLVKFSPSGSLLWQKAMGGSRGEMNYTICQTTDKGYAIAGYSASDSTGDVGSNPTLPVSNNFWIVKLASELHYSTTAISVCASALPYAWNSQSYNSAGAYQVTLTGANCADSIATLNLTVNPTPAVTLGDDATICSGKTLSFNVTTANATYLWQDGSINPRYDIIKDGTYWVKLNVNGCENSDTIHVDFKDCNCVPSIPNAFTPNGDGINDQWIISHRCDVPVIVSIYNRYGSLIYHADDYKDNWTATYKSKPCPDGTYYYVVKLVYPNQKVEVFKGDLTILR